MSAEEENDEKDEKSIVKLMNSTLPKFSNETDWEMAIFEIRSCFGQDMAAQRRNGHHGIYDFIHTP